MHFVWLDALTMLINNPINVFQLTQTLFYIMFFYQIFMDIDNITSINNVIIDIKVITISV